MPSLTILLVRLLGPTTSSSLPAASSSLILYILYILIYHYPLTLPPSHFPCLILTSHPLYPFDATSFTSYHSILLSLGLLGPYNPIIPTLTHTPPKRTFPSHRTISQPLQHIPLELPPIPRPTPTSPPLIPLPNTYIPPIYIPIPNPFPYPYHFLRHQHRHRLHYTKSGFAP